MRRFKILSDLISFKEPIAVLSERLKTLGWDYEGPGFYVKSSEIRGVLNRFVSGEISVDELEEWANLIECREDLQFEDAKSEQIDHVIFLLANPALEGQIDYASCKKLINSLD